MEGRYCSDGFQSARFHAPEQPESNTSADAVESVRLDFESTVALQQQEESPSRSETLELKNKFSGLNSKCVS